MDIDELIEQCPRFSRVVFHAHASSSQMYRTASPGDAVHLFESGPEGPTGNRVTALIVGCERTKQSDVVALRPFKDPDL